MRHSEVYKQASQVFGENIAAIHAWLDENKDNFEAYEEAMAQEMLTKLAEPMPRLMPVLLLLKDIPTEKIPRRCSQNINKSVRLGDKNVGYFCITCGATARANGGILGLMKRVMD